MRIFVQRKGLPCACHVAYSYAVEHHYQVVRRKELENIDLNPENMALVAAEVAIPNYVDSSALSETKIKSHE